MKTFWDIAAVGYDFAERLINRSVYDHTGERCAEHIPEGSRVLECACGTGSISCHLAKKAGSLRAVDISSGMLRQAEKNLKGFDNVKLCKGDICSLKCRDSFFDAVVAGNVIHLLDEPCKAIDELIRVCRPGGKVIIPTYINLQQPSTMFLVKLIDKAGASFKRQFDEDSYRQFFKDGGYTNVEFEIVNGRMPCMLAIITRS